MESPAKFIIAFQNRLKAGNCCQMHSHAGVEIVFHFSGQGSTRCADGEVFEFVQGDVVVYPPNMAHDQRMRSEGVDHCLQVGMVEVRQFPCFERAFKLSGICSQTLLSELSDLSCWFDEVPKEARDLRSAATLLTLFHENAGKGVGSHDSAFLQASEARRIAMSELAKPPSSSTIAKRLGLSPDYLRHLMSRYFGKGLKELSLEARLARAMSLLSNSPMGLKELADETGFANERALCAAFKLRLGSTPGQFRRRSQAGRGD